eukprot:3500855-Pyramimonas_sp.AAC.1
MSPSARTEVCPSEFTTGTARSTPRSDGTAVRIGWALGSAHCHMACEAIWRAELAHAPFYGS